MIGRHSRRYVSSVSENTRTRPANAATFTTDAMKAVTGVGDPWYTSGAHAWNGTAETLNPRPTRSNEMPVSSSPSWMITTSDRYAWMSARLVDPVAPYIMAMPYSRNAEANAPSTKYFMPA